jgi:anti-sigma regulatory factor (Ser/Thr protein kinase)
MTSETATLTAPGLLEHVPCIRHWLQDALSAWGVSTEVIADLVLAVTELCTNIVRHGYGDTARGDISLQISRTGGVIRVIVMDTAAAFVPEKAVPPPPGALAEGGYGLFLIDTLVDEVSYERLGECGNRITLVKYDVLRRHDL